MDTPRETSNGTIEIAVVHGLDPSQAAAVVAIVEGGSFSQAAAAAGVDRTTLWRWRTEDPRFIAALQSWSREQRAAARERLSGILASCADTVAKAVAEGDARLAMRLLEKSGAASDLTDEPTPVPAIPVYDACMVQLREIGPNPGAVAEYLCGLFTGGADEVAALLRPPLPRYILGPYTMQRTEPLVAGLRGVGADAVTVRVKVVCHEVEVTDHVVGETFHAEAIDALAGKDKPPAPAVKRLALENMSLAQLERVHARERQRELDPTIPKPALEKMSLGELQQYYAEERRRMEVLPE